MPVMHAHRYDDDDDAPAPSAPLDAAQSADNDNDVPADASGEPSSELPGELSGAILPRRFARRDWVTAALLVASYGLSAYAWTHPRGGTCREPAPVTPVALAALAHAPPPEAPIVVPDLPPAAPPAAPARVRSPEPHNEAVTARAVAPAPAVEEERAPSPPARRAAPAPAAEEAAEVAEEAGPTSGDIDVALEGAVNDHQREVDSCIHDADDAAAGQVSVRLVITPEGSVRSATPRAPASLVGVGRCLARAIRGWTIAVPGAAADVSTSWTFEVESNAD